MGNNDERDEAQDITLDTSGDIQQYLTFALEDEIYGVDILRVQEIRGWEAVTRIPNAPDFVKGVLNMRGSIVPIIDMRMRFNLPSIEYTKMTVIIVLSVESEQGSRIMGVVVDSVSDVVNVKKSEIRPAPDFGSKVSVECLSGLAMVDGKMVILLDVDRMLAANEIVMLDAITPE